jgi:hypothetical protein
MITFEPSRRRHDSGFDLTALPVKNPGGNGTINAGIDIKIAAHLRRDLGYVKGDRVVGHFDEKQKSFSLERVGIDDDRPAYKVRFGSWNENRKKTKSSNQNMYVRFGCREEDLKEFFGDHARLAYEFLEIDKKGWAVFVPAEA